MPADPNASAPTALALAAKDYLNTVNWTYVLDKAWRWNRDDFRAVARGRLDHEPDLNEMREAIASIAEQVLSEAVIQQEPCTTPVPHDDKDCNGA